MKRTIKGKLQKLSNENIRELNKIPNTNILSEIESNPELKKFLIAFKAYIEAEKKTPNAKELRFFTKEYKKNLKHLPIPAKQLKTKTVLYLRALQSL